MKCNSTQVARSRLSTPRKKIKETKAAKDVYARILLDTSRREIRLLTLSPGEGDDALHGELFTERLDYDDLHYTAVSYTWAGIPIQKNIVTLGGLPFQITSNLKAALRRLQGPLVPKLSGLTPSVSIRTM